VLGAARAERETRRKARTQGATEEEVVLSSRIIRDVDLCMAGICWNLHVADVRVCVPCSTSPPIACPSFALFSTVSARGFFASVLIKK
jgi:hypothetical protein